MREIRVSMETALGHYDHFGQGRHGTLPETSTGTGCNNLPVLRIEVDARVGEGLNSIQGQTKTSPRRIHGCSAWRFITFVTPSEFWRLVFPGEH